MNSKISRRELIKASGLAVVVPALPVGTLLSTNTLAAEPLSGELIKRNPIGFHGQPKDPVLGLYQYGNGYRLYNPYLRRFQQFDLEMAPFGEAGTNGYLFVSNDPFNRIDPDGRLDIMGLVGGILAAIFSIAAFTATVLTGGLVAPLGLALASTTLLSGLVSGSTGVAAAIINDPSHPAYDHLSKASMWSGLVVDVASVAIGGVGVLKAGTSALKLTSSANKALGFSAQNMIKQISKAKWISKVEMGLEALDTTGTSMGIAAHYQGDSALSKVGLGFNIGANVGKLPFYSRMPARMAASKVAGVKSASEKGLGKYFDKDFSQEKSSSHFLGKKLGSVSTGQVAVGKSVKETVRTSRIARNISKSANMQAPSSMLAAGWVGPASANAELSRKIIQPGELSLDLERHSLWKGSESSGYGYGLEYLN